MEQEMGTARFIETRNIGRVVSSRDCDVASDIISFLKYTALINTMKENVAKLSQSFSCTNPMQYFREFSSKSSCRPEIMLTFDDGPDPAYTGRLLDLLDSCGIKAAFFTVGSFASANPGLKSRMKDGGHTVGLHSYSHKSAYLMTAAADSQRFIHVCGRSHETGHKYPFLQASMGTHHLRTAAGRIKSWYNVCLLECYVECYGAGLADRS